MSKFAKGDRVRQIPSLLPPILGAPRDVVCVVVRSEVEGAGACVDIQMPEGEIVTSLPAMRFEKVRVHEEDSSIE